MVEFPPMKLEYESAWKRRQWQWDIYPCLSRRRTFAPRSRRVCAAERPARPPPTTMTDIVEQRERDWREIEWMRGYKSPARRSTEVLDFIALVQACSGFGVTNSHVILTVRKGGPRKFLLRNAAFNLQASTKIAQIF